MRFTTTFLRLVVRTLAMTPVVTNSLTFYTAAATTNKLGGDDLLAPCVSITMESFLVAVLASHSSLCGTEVLKTPA